MVKSPTSPKSKGFLPIPNMNSNDPRGNMNPPLPIPSYQPSPGGYSNGEHIVNIPLTPIKTSVSSTGARKEGQTMNEYSNTNNGSQLGSDGNGDFQPSYIGRRRAKSDAVLNPQDEGALTTMGKIYDKILKFSILTRYILYIVPLSLVFVIPIIVSIYGAPNAKIGGVRMLWFFAWLEIVWCSLWLSKLVAKALPLVFQTLVGVISSSVKKYSQIIKALELPLSLVGWAVASLCSFLPLMTRNVDVTPERLGVIDPWMNRLNKFLVSCLVTAVIWFCERLLIRIVSVSYYRRQFESRIKTNKENVKVLAELYEISRNLFPEYTEFREEDYIIHQGLHTLNIPGLKRVSGTATPMRAFLGGVNAVQGKVTSVFGNIAQEVTGNKNLMNPNSSYATTIEALRRKVSAEALARRIWMSFVPEGSYALTLNDLKEVMGPERERQAESCFRMIDTDGNGDISLEEMIMHCVNLQQDRKKVTRSLQDVDNAISALDSVLSFIVFVITILIFVIAQQSSVGATLAGAGTVLISLSFCFAITAQEILASCIFLFVKHPYDVGDRIDVDENKYIVEHISLLYTVFKRVDTNKTTQIPNNVLNMKTLENVTRSGSMKESLMVPVSFDTSFEDITKLKYELMLFAQENSRDFEPEVEVEVQSINDLDRLILRIETRYRSNWSNEILTMQRRNRFMLALVAILRRIPIYCPGGGDPIVGEVGRPMYTVAIPDTAARENMANTAKDKKKKRWDYSDSEESDKEEEEEEPRTPVPRRKSSSDETAVSSRPTPTSLGAGSMSMASMMSGSSPYMPVPESRDRRPSGGSNRSRREDQVEEVRSMLSREATRGRRRKPVPGQLGSPAQI
ncbi:Mechanosensitive ion channel-domain-containing protein [Pyronema domesticum]|nr:Mechanosensitive ion channel-domain-containing protein [Pyronema domesticum]